MSVPRAAPSAGRLSMRRFFWVPLGVSALLILAVLTALVAMSWRSLERLRPVQEHLAHIAQIQDVGLAMEQTLLKGLRGAPIARAELESLRDAVRGVAVPEGTLHPDTGRHLQRIARQIARPDTDVLEILNETVPQMRGVLADERARHDGLVREISASSRLELRLSVVLLVILPLGGAAALLLIQHRVAQPLNDLQDLLTRLARRDYRPVPEPILQDTARLAQPAFYSYNALVSRLRELEAEHQDRERTLERRVREATEALLALSRELSRAERLAAVGAVSAGLAHELRNPLAGIQLACSKLHQNLSGGEQAARIAAVIADLKRINHLLTEQVDAARHAPEPLVGVDIGAAVDELLALLRYQAPPGVVLEARVDTGLRCLLPAAGLRQALLNLLLNAVQSVGGSGRVTVAAGREAERLALRVSDDGPGFPADLLRSGIRPFATGRSGGTGLGLAMVRRFARDLDGEMELDNQAPRGAQVILRLPCRDASRTGGGSDA